MNTSGLGDFEGRAQKILEPIPGEDPGGDELRGGEDLPELDTLAYAVSQGDETERAGELIRKAEELLQSKSKHLKVVNHWLAGIEISGSTEDFHLGLSVFRRLLDKHWEHLWPRATPRRCRILEPMNRTLAERFVYLECSAEDVPVLGRCWLELKDIQEVVRSHLRDEKGVPFSLHEICTVIEDRVRALTGKPFEPPSPEKPGAKSIQGGAPTEEATAASLASETETVAPDSGQAETGPAAEQAPPAPAEAEAEDPWVQGLLQEIPGDQPQGEDPRRSEDPSHPFVLAKDLFLNLSSGVVLPEDTSWPQLVEACEATLRDHAKDIFAATWLSFGLYHIEGHKGLLSGLGLLERLIARYGERCLPDRPRARFNALQLFNERLAETVRNVTPVDSPDPAVLKQTLDIVEHLTAAFRELVGPEGGPISLRLLSEVLQDRLKKIAPVEEPVPTEAPSVETPTADVAGPSVAGTAPEPSPPAKPTVAPDISLAVPEGEEISLKQFLSPLRQYADQWRNLDATSPFPYRLLRTSLWGPVADLPPQKEPGVTRLLLQQRRKDSLAKPLETNNWSLILNFCESMFSEGGPFLYWLDLQRHVHTSLQNLGEPYADAANAVALETALFLERLPGIERLAFDDTTPFADSETVSWISKEVKPRLKGSQGSAGITVDEKNLEPVRTALQTENMADALDLFWAWYRVQHPGVLKILGVLEGANKLESRGQIQLARGILSSMAEEMDRLHAENWVPELCIEVWDMLRRCNDRVLGQLRKGAGEASPAEQKRRDQAAVALEAANQTLLERMIRVDWRKTDLLSESP